MYHNCIINHYALYESASFIESHSKCDKKLQNLANSTYWWKCHFSNSSLCFLHSWLSKWQMKFNHHFGVVKRNHLSSEKRKRASSSIIFVNSLQNWKEGWVNIYFKCLKNSSCNNIRSFERYTGFCMSLDHSYA